MEKDFFTLKMEEHKEKWNAISLSLVVNFIPSPADRGDLNSVALRPLNNFITGRMLRMAHCFLKSGGYLFLAVR